MIFILKRLTMNKRQIRLNESDMRKFVSYSVAKLLKEAIGAPIYDRHGEYDGYEESRYGSDSTKIDFDPFNDDDQMAAFQQACEEMGCPIDEFDDGGRFGDIWPVMVTVSLDRKKGMAGSYDVPDDPDETTVTDWEADTADLGAASQVIDKALEIYFNDGYFDPDDSTAGFAGLNEENRGVMFHNDGKSPFKPNEAGKGGDSSEKKPNEKNKGVTFHSNGKKSERNKEDDDHMFDDKYWAEKNKVRVGKDELSEMIQETIKSILRERGIR